MGETVSIVTGSAYASTAFDAFESAYKQLIEQLNKVRINISYSINLSHHIIYCPQTKIYFASMVFHFTESKK